MTRWVMHLDMDAFFAAVEQRDHPDLQGKPVIIGAKPGGRGVVSTCSYEARVFGVRSAMPISTAWRLCPDGVYLTPDMRRYILESEKIMEILGEISPVVEPVSIDEAFLDISGLERLFGTPEEIGQLARNRIRERTGLTASVGVGPNRLIAKIASDYRKPDGLTVVHVEDVLNFLAPMPVSRLRGAGRILVEKLHRQGIMTIEQLRCFSETDLAGMLGENAGAMLFAQARGLGSDRVETGRERKSISKERTFMEDCNDPEILRDCLHAQAEEVGQIARKKQLRGRTVTLKIRFQGFETRTRQCRLPDSTDIDGEIFRAAWELFRKAGFGNRPVRLIGLGISDFHSGGQMGLFDKECEKKRDVLQARDAIVRRFGKAVLRPRKGDG